MKRWHEFPTFCDESRLSLESGYFRFNSFKPKKVQKGDYAMKKFKNFSRKLFKNQAGQGATEYILLLVVVVGLVMTFKNDIKKAFTDKVTELSGSIGSIKSTDN